MGIHLRSPVIQVTPPCPFCKESEEVSVSPLAGDDLIQVSLSQLSRGIGERFIAICSAGWDLHVGGE